MSTVKHDCKGNDLQCDRQARPSDFLTTLFIGDEILIPNTVIIIIITTMVRLLNRGGTLAPS